MKSIFQAFVGAAAAVLLSLTIGAGAVRAQEGEPVVVDEVIAQVNDQIITLSQVKREMREAVEAMMAQGASEQQATEEVSKRRNELIASLINEQIIVQKGKELNMTDDVEAEVNRRMLLVAKEQNIPTMQALEEAMRAAGVDPAVVRDRLRSETMKEMVFNDEVDRKIFLSITSAEAEKYFKAHADKFRKAETVSLSEIWLPLGPGINEADVKAKATQLVTQARAGANFGELAAANSERIQNGQRIAPQNKGKVGTFQVPDLRADLATAIKNVQAGGVTDPIRTNEGYQILRVDERSPAATAAEYNEMKVREVITMERREKERVDYMQRLRKEAYIKISDNYRAAIEPLLPGLNTQPAASASKPGDKDSGKDKKNKP
ncbi:MAG TPA: peptidyl-prolyl cis-trans isomerase [Pyrinomonadaceae bacterium]|nr:peptidyl-prolyl cis-trans isomerase [Pyrinomonadaceae bacterium]